MSKYSPPLSTRSGLSLPSLMLFSTRRARARATYVIASGKSGYVNNYRQKVMAMANRKRRASERSVEQLIVEPFKSTRPHPVDFIETEMDLDETDLNLGDENHSANANVGLRCEECNQEVRANSQNLFYYRIFGEHSSRRSHRVLALTCSAHAKRPRTLGLKIKKSWWSLDQVLTSQDTERDGVVKVTTFGERIVLSVLNGIISNMEPQSENGSKFNLQPPNEAASIVWQEGVAVGFYSVKRRGRLTSPYSGEAWALNILDTIFVSKSHRFKGLAKAMLEDFLESYPNEDVGLSFPVENPMLKVCQKVLMCRKKDQERLWECEEPGYPGQRRNIWLAVSNMH